MIFESVAKDVKKAIQSLPPPILPLEMPKIENEEEDDDDDDKNVSPIEEQNVIQIEQHSLNNKERSMGGVEDLFHKPAKPERKRKDKKIKIETKTVICSFFVHKYFSKHTVFIGAVLILDENIRHSIISTDTFIQGGFFFLQVCGY